MGAKILVVDDDLPILELLKCDFTAEGFEVRTARNEEEFRRQALSEKPDLIVLDIMLGDKNGPLVYDELLAQGLDRSIPVIFLSALAENGTPNSGAPGRKYLLCGKPFDSDELIREIRNLVGNKVRA